MDITRSNTDRASLPDSCQHNSGQDRDSNQPNNGQDSNRHSNWEDGHRDNRLIRESCQTMPYHLHLYVTLFMIRVIAAEVDHSARQ